MTKRPENLPDASNGLAEHVRFEVLETRRGLTMAEPALMTSRPVRFTVVPRGAAAAS